jgi:hypothetical protein
MEGWVSLRPDMDIVAKWEILICWEWKSSHPADILVTVLRQMTAEKYIYRDLNYLIFVCILCKMWMKWMHNVKVASVHVLAKKLIIDLNEI